MALYLGGHKLKVNLNNILYKFNIYSAIAILNGIKLLSSDDYILKDSNGVYLTAKKESDE
jgi:hypothetical protein